MGMLHEIGKVGGLWIVQVRHNGRFVDLSNDSHGVFESESAAKKCAAKYSNYSDVVAFENSSTPGCHMTFSAKEYFRNPESYKVIYKYLTYQCLVVTKIDMLNDNILALELEICDGFPCEGKSLVRTDGDRVIEPDVRLSMSTTDGDARYMQRMKQVIAYDKSK